MYRVDEKHNATDTRANFSRDGNGIFVKSLHFHRESKIARVS